MLKLWMARLFGRRVTGSDDGILMVGYVWRGKLYITALKPR